MTDQVGFIFGHLVLGTHTWTMSRDVTDAHGDRVDFASGNFLLVCYRGKRDFFLGGQPSSKSPPKKSKGPFFEMKRTVKMTLGKSARSLELSVIVS